MNNKANKDLKPFRLGPWLILPEINRITGPNVRENVGSRTMHVLVILASRQGEVVGKEELLEKVWNDVIVTEDSLMKSISVLRQIFHKNHQNNPKIDTVRGIGYMLLTPVEFIDKKDIQHGFKSKRSKIMAYSFVFGAMLITLSGLIFTSGFIEKGETTGIVNVTNDWGQERVPRFSPNGQRVLYAGATEGWNNMDIYIKDLNDNKVSKVVDGEFLETDPIWAPDGKSIAYFRNMGKIISIYIKDLQSGSERKVTDIDAIINLSAMVWTTDGEWIIFADRSRRTWKSSLYKINVHTGTKIRLTHPEGRIIGDLSPRLSPDTKFLAYIRASKSSMMFNHLIPGQGSIMIRNQITGDIQEILKLDSDVSGIAWIDHDHVAYAVNHKNYNFRVYKLNIRTKEQNVILETPNIVRNLDYHVNSNKLVFETWNERYAIWNYTARDREPNFSGRYLKNTRSNWQPKFHKASNSVAYISTQSGSAELWVRNNNTEEITQLTHFQGPVVRNASWSPDGDKIIFEVNIDGQDDIYQVDLVKKHVTPWLSTEFEEKNPVWSEDGKHIYYASDKTGQFEIWKKELYSNSSAKQVTSSGGFRALLHNGELYYSKGYSRGIWKLSGKKEEKIIDRFSPNDAGNWDIANGQLYYIKRSRFWRPEMYKFDLTTKQDEHYQSFTMSVSSTFSGLTYDCNSQEFLITHNDRNRSDLKMMAHGNTSIISKQISFITGF